MTVVYTLYNMTLRMVEITSAVEASDAFLYSGYKTCSFKILPLASHILKFTLLPLSGGNCILPRLKLKDASAANNSSAPANVDKKGESLSPAATTTPPTTAADTLLKINFASDDLTVFVRPRIEE